MLLVTLNFEVTGVRYCYAHVTPADFCVHDADWVSVRDAHAMYDASVLTDLGRFLQFVRKIDPTIPATYAMLGARCIVEHTELTRLTVSS